MTHDDYCVKHRECEPGTGVQTKGTPLTNTVCETCSEGYFSSSPSALDSCVKHQECTDGQLVLLPGSIYHDTVCGSCEDFTAAGESFKAFISGIFNSHKVRFSKMKRFVNRYINKSARKRDIMSMGRQKGALLNKIISWLALDPQHLTQLPKMLRESELNPLAEMLEVRLSGLCDSSQVVA